MIFKSYQERVLCNMLDNLPDREAKLRQIWNWSRNDTILFDQFVFLMDYITSEEYDGTI